MRPISKGFCAGVLEDRHEAVGVAVELEVVHQPEVLQDVDLREVDRAFPVEVGQHVENHQLVLVQRVLFDVDVYRVNHLVAVLFGHDARSDGVLLVHRQRDALGGDVVGHRTVGELDLAARVVAAHEVHHLADVHRAVDAVRDVDHVVVVGVLALGQRERNPCGLVGLGLHLVDVPLAPEVGGVHDPHVGAHAVDLLVVPQREGVVVAVVEDDRVGKR